MDPLLKLLEDHPLIDPPDSNGKRKLFYYSYGTAGFRYKAELMEGVVARVGICCALLLLKKQKDADMTGNMGIMLTASHNDESYNGVKISNPDGSMIDSKQEEFLVKWVNQRNIGEWKSMLQTTISEEESQTSGKATPSPVWFHFGRDTRSHSPSLSKLMIESAKQTMALLNFGKVQDHGILTTPMLHHIVLHSNPTILPKLLQPPRPSRNGYVEWLSEAYGDLTDEIHGSTGKDCELPKLLIDCACGVGYDAVNEVDEAIGKKLGTTGRLIATNGPSDGPLNTKCGSEHVQKQLMLPTFYANSATDGGNNNDTIDYGCSLDGDADRIVFFASQNQQLTLLDGDKIAILIANFFKKLNLPESLKMGVVQTAYANGASTEYLRNTLQIPVIITKTGVKHLHHAAVHNFDIGIYFEANGHGTVIFGPKFHEEMNRQHPGGTMLSKVAKLINPAVGDAISDLLLVDAILQYEQWTTNPLSAKWNSLYQDLPSRQLKVAVKDRSVVTCNDNETKCLTPTTLQPALDKLMSDGGPLYRTFVRASGTENVVRVYAEAPSRDEADKLASAAEKLVQEHCGGVDPLSSI